jgi:hypothetical protein
MVSKTHVLTALTTFEVCQRSQDFFEYTHRIREEVHIYARSVHEITLTTLTHPGLRGYIYDMLDMTLRSSEFGF